MLDLKGNSEPFSFFSLFWVILAIIYEGKAESNLKRYNAIGGAIKQYRRKGRYYGRSAVSSQ